ncbi:hypothetical protein IFR05_008653 [Cadophora sp. M221]|nr:hypothetical protein IFR05_008653 [Cadophora sp. M221]
MTRHDTGLFAGFNLEDTRSLRTLHLALDYWYKGGRSIHRGPLSKLSKLQRSTIEMAVQRMQHSPLLQDIIMTFLKLPKKDPKTLQAGGRDLDLYAVTSTYEPKTYAYKEAEEAWKNRQPLGMPGNVDPDHKTIVKGLLEIFELEKAADEAYLRKIGYGPNITDGIGYNSDECSHSNNSDDDDFDMAFPSYMPPVIRDQAQDNAGVWMAGFELVTCQVEQQQRVPLVAIKHASANKGRIQSRGATPGMAGMAAKKRNTRRDLREDFNQKLSLHSNPYMKPEEDVSDRVLLPKGNIAQNLHKTKPIRKVKMMPGSIIININDIDREKAKLGLVNPSKLVIVFKTAKPELSTGEMVPGTSLNYRYSSRTLDVFDWNSIEHISALNNWRQDVIHRRLEPLRKPRVYWLVSELKDLLDLAEIQLQTYGTLKWDLLVKTFNHQNAGLIDGADEELICRGRRSSSILGETRLRPQRTKASLIALCRKDSQFGALLAKYNSSYAKISTGEPKLKESDSEGDLDYTPGHQPRKGRQVLKDNNGGSLESANRGLKRKRESPEVEDVMDVVSA